MHDVRCPVRMVSLLALVSILEAVTVTHSMLNELLADDIGALVDKVKALPDGEAALSQLDTLQILHAALWLHGTRAGSFAAAYAITALQEALTGVVISGEQAKQLGWTFEVEGDPT